MSRARDIADGKFSGAVVAASADFTGTVEAADLSDGTTTVGTEYVTNGSAKAWVNFNGTGTIAARDSFNVSSLTDNGTGDYTLAYTTAFANGNYAANATGEAYIGIRTVVLAPANGSYNTGSTRYAAVLNTDAGLFDLDDAQANTIGDLA